MCKNNLKQVPSEIKQESFPGISGKTTAGNGIFGKTIIKNPLKIFILWKLL